jgi:murein DD-endopeptidase MepM/ murein hydrolase activator NlpD
MGSALVSVRAGLVAAMAGRPRPAISRLLLVSLCVTALSGLHAVEVLQHVEQRVLHKVEQKLVDKLKQKLGSRVDEFRSRLHARWQELETAWRQRLSRVGARLEAAWQAQAREIETAAAGGDLAHYPAGIPPTELTTARESLVDPTEMVGGAGAGDPAAEVPAMIRFNPRDADKAASGPGLGNLADRVPEPATDAGDHASELPNVPAEVDAVRSLCAKHPACVASPAADAGFDPLQEQLRLRQCCRVLEAPGVAVIPDDVIGAADGIPADVIPGAAEVLPADVGVGGGTGEGAVDVRPPGLARGPASPTPTPTCDTPCQTFSALVEAAAHVLSDFDQTKHGPGNQEGLGQLLPHLAVGDNGCVSGEHLAAAATFDIDLRQIGCELIADLGASRGDVPAAFALYVKRNHLPPLDAAWPGQVMPAPGPRLADPICAGDRVAGTPRWNSSLGGDSESDFVSLTLTSDCRSAHIATASLLTAVSRIYFDWNTDPTAAMDANAFDDATTRPVATADGEDAPNHPAQVAAAAAYNAGFRGHDLLVATALAGAESSWSPGSSGARDDGRLGVGLWRIPIDTRRGWTAASLVDPDTNARAAYAMSEPRGDFSDLCGAWRGGACGGGGPAAYLAYIDEARGALADLVMLDNNGIARGGLEGGAPTLTWPLMGPISQGFGCTALAMEPLDSHCPGGHFHSGIDIAAECGTPIRAAVNGTMSVHSLQGGYGNYVTIDLGAGWMTLYGHLAGFNRGDGPVQAADLIGREGSTGNSTGCHVHFEVRHRGTPVDPRPLLP